MGPRPASPRSLPSFVSHWLSLRRLFYLALALLTFFLLFRPYSRGSDLYDDAASIRPASPLASGLAHVFPNLHEDPDALGPGFGESERMQLARLKEEQDRMLAEQEKARAEEEADRKKQEEQERKRKKQEAEKKQKDEEEAAKQKQQEETDRNQKLNVELDVKNSGATDKQPENVHQFTTTFVTGRRVQDEANSKWFDLLKDITHKRIYIVDDPTAELHLDKNKGRESIVYIKYIVEFYDNLDDVTLFYHSSRDAWHNTFLLAKDAAVMINNLRRSWVVEKGYMNARCELYPGCPSWITWNATKAQNDEHPERTSDLFQASLWDKLFPNRTHNPVTLAQPCCSQFAVSRDTIRRRPKAQYELLYKWLATTDTADVYSGRIMEYVWQYLFLDEDEHCPDMAECYCKGYGICISDDAGIKRHDQLMAETEDIRHKMDDWDNARGCNDGHVKGEARKNCRKDNPWEAPLKKTQGDRMDLEGQLVKHYGISSP